ncbi:arylesterase [Szabonella alba]|nr:arylesterase [Szabonella alba]
MALILGLGLLPAVAQAQEAAEVPVIVALGDSLTQGYGLPADQGFVPQLQDWLTAQGVGAGIVNAGVSGDTTAGGAARLDWSLSGDVDALIVNLGGNDLLRGLDPDVSRANLEKIMDGAAARDLPVLLVGLSAPGNYGADFKTRYDAIFPDLAERFDALLMPDFLAPLRDAGGEAAAAARFMQADGIHPSAEGVAVIVESIGPQVVDLIGRVSQPDAGG